HNDQPPNLMNPWLGATQITASNANGAGTRCIPHDLGDKRIRPPTATLTPTWEHPTASAPCRMWREYVARDTTRPARMSAPRAASKPWPAARRLSSGIVKEPPVVADAFRFHTAAEAPAPPPPSPAPESGVVVIAVRGNLAEAARLELLSRLKGATVIDASALN